MSAFVDQDLLPVQGEFDLQARINALEAQDFGRRVQDRVRRDQEVARLRGQLQTGTARNVTPESLERRRVAQFRGRRSTIQSLEGQELGRSFNPRPASVLGT